MKDFSDELRVTGEYRVPGIYGASDSIVPKYNFPITPKENMVRMLKGENPCLLYTSKIMILRHSLRLCHK